MLFYYWQIEFTFVCVLGCVGMNVASYALLGANTNTTCVLRQWGFGFFFVIFVAPLILKSYRLHRLFNSVSLAEAHLLPPLVMFGLACLMCAVVVIILITVTAQGGFDAATISAVDSQGALSEHIQCLPAAAGSLVLYVYQGILILGGCALSYLTRNVDPAFGESKALMFVMYAQ